MNSRSKFELSEKMITRLFQNANINPINHIKPLGDGEFNSIYSCDSNDSSYVLKVAPYKKSCLLTYEINMMKQELYFYSLIQEKTTIKTPKILYSDFTYSIIPTAYFIMEKIDGVQSDKLSLDENQSMELNHKIADILAQIHRLKNNQFGYIQNGLYENWFLAISSMVQNLIHDASSFLHMSKRGKKLLAYIHQNQRILEKVESRLVNFDIWPSNLLCQCQENQMDVCLIDLERCFYGDFIADFVSQDFMAMTLTQKSNLIQTYLSMSDTQIKFTEEEEIRFAIMLGYLALILEVEKYARYSIFHYGFWRNVGGSKLLFTQCFKTLKSFKQ